MTQARRILIVEDDDSIALGLKLNLEAEGYDVHWEADGEQGLGAARSLPFDLFILDLMLPKLNGFSIVQTLRREGNVVPIIMLSARGAESDKVTGLELGAEDYITKPFGLAELLARVKAVLRRSEMQKAHLAEERKGRERVLAGSLEINPATREILKDGVPVVLTATEFDVLWCLVAADGGVLSRERILAEVWGPDHHGTLRTIDNFLLQLRTKLEDDPAAPRHLITVRGVGYRFAC